MLDLKTLLVAKHHWTHRVNPERLVHRSAQTTITIQRLDPDTPITHDNWLMIMTTVDQGYFETSSANSKPLFDYFDDFEGRIINCRECGSEEIIADASARWFDGAWDLSSVHDCKTCDACGASSDTLAIALPTPPDPAADHREP